MVFTPRALPTHFSITGRSKFHQGLLVAGWYSSLQGQSRNITNIHLQKSHFGGDALIAHCRTFGLSEDVCSHQKIIFLDRNEKGHPYIRNRMRGLSTQQRGNSQHTRHLTTIAHSGIHLDRSFYGFHYRSSKVREQVSHHGGCGSIVEVCSFLRSSPPVYTNLGCSNFHGSDLQIAWHAYFYCVRLRPDLHQQFLAGNIQNTRHSTKTQYFLPSENRWSNWSSQQMSRNLP